MEGGYKMNGRDETPDMRPYDRNPYSSGYLGPYGIDGIQPWYYSRTLWSCIASFSIWGIRAIVDISNEVAIQLQSMIVMLGLVFSRLGNKKIVSGRRYREIKKKIHGDN